MQQAEHSNNVLKSRSLNSLYGDETRACKAVGDIPCIHFPPHLEEGVGTSNSQGHSWRGVCCDAPVEAPELPQHELHESCASPVKPCAGAPGWARHRLV